MAMGTPTSSPDPRHRPAPRLRRARRRLHNLQEPPMCFPARTPPFCSRWRVERAGDRFGSAVAGGAANGRTLLIVGAPQACSSRWRETSTATVFADAYASDFANRAKGPTTGRVYVHSGRTAGCSVPSPAASPKILSGSIRSDRRPRRRHHRSFADGRAQRHQWGAVGPRLHGLEPQSRGPVATIPIW